ncbi:Uncharacterized protein APZ42_010677, partial [Daphnia magna]
HTVLTSRFLAFVSHPSASHRSLTMSLFFHYLILLGLGVAMGNNYKAPYHQPKYEPKYGPEIPACSKNT